MTPMRQSLIAAAASVSVGTTALARGASMESSGARTVNARQIFELVNTTPNIVILDNRKEEDFAAGHLEGAVRLIDTDVTAESLAKHINSKDTPALFYCNGVKCGRAAKAAEK